MQIAKYSALHPNQHFRGHSYRHGSQTLKKATVPAEVKPPVVVKPPTVKPPAPDRVVIPTGVVIRPGDSYKIGSYEFGVNADGTCTVTVTATGHVHVLLFTGHPGSYAEYQPDGNFVGNWIDAKGKRHVQFASKTQFRARGGEMALTVAGSLAIFNRKHVLVKRWG
jgi:hypothetical protein